MAVARIQTSPVAVSRSAISGQVTSGIWLTVDGTDFPDHGWDDFVLVVLAWWANALRRVLSGESSRERVRFMDGPYYVDIERERIGDWRLVLFEERQTGPVARLTASIAPTALVESVQSASKEILKICRARQWESEEARHLVVALAALREWQ